MTRRSCKRRSAARFAAAATVLALVLTATSPASVRAASDLVGGDAGADALTAALAAASTPSGNASTIPPPPPSWAADAAAWASALRRDADLKFSPSTNQLVYTCAHMVDNNSPAVALAEMALATDMALAADAIVADPSGFATPKEQDPAIADAFRLHSRPGAPKKIVLDFTGHTLRTGTYWGTAVSKIGDVPIVTPPYDLDGNPSSFSTAELQAIVAIWRQIAEDYSRWDVDVTTEEPAGTDDQADAALAGNGQRLIIGRNTGWFDNAGGVAFIDTFGHADTGPVAFVFNTRPASVAIAGSHELGHTLGLRHHGTVAKPDGTGASGYYAGHGAWAPIMGVGYGKNVIQWSKGDFAYASEPNQDDIAIISRTLAPAPWSGGGRDMATAELVEPPSNGKAVVSGIFTSSTESHFYKFYAHAAGSAYLQLSVNPRGVDNANSRTHLAAKVRILQLSTMAGVPTQFNNVGSTGIDGNIPDTSDKLFSLPAAGDYYIEMAATGNGDATTGYTPYGTSGTYALTVSGDPNVFPVRVAPPPNLICYNATTLQLTQANNNCNTGVAVQAMDVYYTLDQRPAAVSPALGTVLAAGASRAFTATLDGASCTTTVKVLACSTLPDTVTCLNPSYTLTSGQCDGKAVPPAELYRLAGPNGAAPSGTATTTLPADGVLGPGKHQIQVTASAGGATCTSVVTVTPCKPVVISTTTAVRVQSAPGVCAGTPAPSAVVSAATLGRGALSINARTSSTGSIVPMPVKAGKYYVQVVYPGSVTSSVSSSSVPISVTDVEDPRAAIKPAIVRDSRGFICARGGSSTSTTACVSLSTSTGVLDLADNCGVSSLTRSYQCSSSQNACPSTMSSTTTKLCVPVKAGGGRIEATYLLTVTDKGGRKAQVMIPIAGYHYRDKPVGVTCYTA